MGRIFIALFLFLGWGCNSDENPVLAPYLPEPAALGPAAKASASPTWWIWWPCEAEADLVWTVFNGRFEFHIEGSEVTVAERNPSRKVLHQDHDAVVVVADGYCWLTSSFVQPNSALRIFRGHVRRDIIHRYYLEQGDDTYLLNRRYVSADGEYSPPFEQVGYRDFLDLNNRNKPRPEGLYELRSQYHVRAYYLPVNFSAAALKTLVTIPEDDRPFLERHFVQQGGAEDAPEEEDDSSGASSSGSSGISSSGSSITSSSGGSPAGNQGNQGSGNQPLAPCPGGEERGEDGVCPCPEGEEMDDEGVCQSSPPPPSIPILSISVWALPDEVNENTSTTFAITVTNSGTAAAESQTISLNPGSLTTTSGTIAVGASVTKTFSVTAPDVEQDGHHTYTACVGSICSNYNLLVKAVHTTLGRPTKKVYARGLACCFLDSKFYAELV